MLSQGNALKTVSEISTKSCTDTRGMICILPAKINCTNSCMSNDTLICLQCKVEDIQTIKQGQTLAKQLTDTCSDSRMTCYGETRLHKHILNWNKDKLLDTCSKPLTIQQGHFPVYSDISDTITFSENTKCTGNPECPRKQYESSELIPKPEMEEF
ncbi:uncharacterized protein LOC133184943 isoform X2 [Saccostrea echinata]|uniref:uncharacterized protein LOC133184943 isoform X2 n=1 Tax=Saccostrea echinata TaxID=191078 RepID=UPI002A8273CF|nr:uncharacterized protein LOC133184943 isoform X2 [Saccostrea echinata]